MSRCPYHNTTTPGATEAPPAAVPAGAAVVSAPEEGSSGGGKCPYMRGGGGGDVAADQPPKKLMEQRDWSTATAQDFKEHFTSAYNDLAHSVAGRMGREEVSTILMTRLGYTAAELSIVGEDVWLMQGTGNPHIHANLQPGEFVVDLGSGFGIDAVIMAAKVGATGRVVGIDLSINEIVAALKRVSARQLRNVDFRIGDIESPPFEDSSVDVVMSNGGFCLVPDKAKSFESIFRILKPGGRISISCTVRLKPLDMSKQWPSCMMVFMPADTIDPVLSKIGFVDIGVDMGNSKMNVWNQTRNEEAPKKDGDLDCTIHRGDPKYSFLKELDMSELFARVTIHARKPL